MIEDYKGKGETFEAGGNRPFLLTGKEAAWIIRAGVLDVFAVQLTSGEVSGPRRHLMRLDEGRVLFGLELPDAPTGTGLIAVGIPGTEVIRTSISDVWKDGGIDLAVAVDGWIEALSAGVFKEVAPTGAVRLSSVGGETELAAGAVISPDKPLPWVKQLEGRSLVCEHEHLSLTPEDPFPFPLARHMWLHAPEKGRIASVSTEGIIERKGLRRSLAAFHAVAVDCLSREERSAEREQRERLSAKTRSARNLFEGAIWKLASIIGRREESHVVAGVDHPLVRACQLVAGRLGMEVKVPPELGQGKVMRDPVDGIAAASRFRVRKVILRDGWWRRDNGPLLGFAGPDGTQPVALLPSSPRRYAVHDPVTGKRTGVNRRVAAGISPEAYTFYRHLPETKLGFLDLVRFGLFGNRKDAAMIVLVGAAGGLLGMLVPIFTGMIFDSVIPGSNRGQLLQIGMALMVGAFAAAVFEIARAVAMLRIEGRMDANLQSAVIDRLLALPVPFFREYTSGDLANRAVGISVIRTRLSGPAATALLSIVFSSFSFFLLFAYSPHLARMATLLIAVAIGIGLLFTLLSLARQRVIQSLDGEISGMLLQYVTGIAKLKISGCEGRAFANWAELFARKRTVDFAARKLTDLKLSIDSVYPVLCSMVIFWAVWRSEGLSTGIFLAFNAAFVSFMSASLEMVRVLQAVVSVVPLYDRLAPIIRTQPEVDRAKAEPGILNGRIDVSRVSFRYTPDGPLILRDVCLKIEPGEFVAVVGGSGSGKSTFFRILLGFESPEQGAVYYNGQDLSELDIRAVRRQMGVVLQNSTLMAGDLYENIVGATNLTVDDAWKAAAMAGVDEEIRQMPMQMQTVIPAGGGTLSGGQRQRIMIARAVVNRPRILLFDEATSALDNRTQAIVGKSLASLTATRVVIAHRLSTIINADKIFVLEKGVVVQSGTYKELINQEGAFAEIARRQII